MRATHLLMIPLILMSVVATAPTASAQRAPTWEVIGCRDVSFLVDRDVIRSTRRDGRFSAIRLNVTGNEIHVYDLKVVYGNGAPDDIPIRLEIRAGSRSGAKDLRGNDRFIDRIEMVYGSKPNFKGHAKVCVEGRTG